METRNIFKRPLLSTTCVRSINEEIRGTELVTCGVTGIRIKLDHKAKFFLIENEDKTERCLVIDKRVWGRRDIFLLERKVWEEIDYDARSPKERTRDEVVIGKKVIRDLPNGEWEFTNLPIKKLGEFPHFIPVDYNQLPRLMRDRGI